MRAVALLLPPLGWMLVFYLAALAVLFVSAFWSIDSFTGKLTHVWTWANFDTIIHDPTYRQIALRTIWMAIAVARLWLIAPNRSAMVAASASDLR